MVLKKIILSLLLPLYICWPLNSDAIEFKPRGNWVISFGYGENGNFQGSYNGHAAPGWEPGQDKLALKERVQLQLEARVNSNLSAYIGFEMGDFVLGNSRQGGALGADRPIVDLSSAYLDFVLPQFPVKARLGLQSIVTPALASGNSVLNGTMAGVVASVMFTEVLTLTALWGRPYNDNYPGYKGGTQANYMDNMDVAALLLPVDFDWGHFTPWAFYAAVGPNVFRGNVGPHGYPFGNNSLSNSDSNTFQGLFPAGGARHHDFTDANGARSLTNYGNGWWVGFSGSFNGLDPFQASVDLEYGRMIWSDDWRLLRSGWFATLLLEYHLDWAIPGIYFWLSSGDDGNPANGSERMPAPDPDNSSNYSRFAFDGAPYLERNALIANNLAGTWGIGMRMVNFAFTDNWKQIFRVNLICGANSPQMAKKMSLAGLWANGLEMEPNELGSGSALGLPGVYLTTLDKALEFGASSFWKMNDNFSINLEIGYIALWLDTSSKVWGARHRLGESIPQTRDAWNMNATFVFSF